MARRLGQLFVFCFAALQLSACPCGCLEHNGWFVLYEDLLFGNEKIADSIDEEEVRQASHVSQSSCGHSHSHTLQATTTTPATHAVGSHEGEHGHCVNVFIRGSASGLLSKGSMTSGNLNLPAAMSTAELTCIANAHNASASCARFSPASPGAIAPPVCALHQVFLI